MKVMFTSNDGGGFADYVKVESGTTVKSFFAKHCSGEPSSFLIRVNRQPVSGDHVLNQNDRITVTPTKIEGAA